MISNEQPYFAEEPSGFEERSKAKPVKMTKKVVFGLIYRRLRGRSKLLIRRSLSDYVNTL